MILLVNKDKKLEQSIDESNFSEMGVWERTHLEEWIADNPNILGEDLLTITTEYDKFDKTSKRLDILAVDAQGKLVVIELKRDIADKFVDLQSIHYAAYCSTLNYEDIVEIRAEYTNKSTEEVDQELGDFIKNEEFTDFDDQPRVILVANEFREETLAAVLWLRISDVDIKCVKLEAYEVKEDIIITPRIIIPLPEARQFMIYRDQKSKKSSEARNSEEHHLKTVPENIKELYDDLKRNIKEIDGEVRVKPKKWYIAFVSKVSSANCIYLNFYQKNIKVILNLKKGELNDPENIAEDVSEIGHRGNGDYRITISPNDNLEYFMSLIMQAYAKYS